MKKKLPRIIRTMPDKEKENEAGVEDEVAPEEEIVDQNIQEKNARTVKKKATLPTDVCYVLNVKV